MNALTNFSFEDQLVRSIRFEGEPYDRWVATDAAKILQYRDAEKLVRLLDEDEASTLLEGTCGLKKGTWLLTLSGLLHAILKSRSPVARPFRRKVTEEWLPQLLYPARGTHIVSTPGGEVADFHRGEAPIPYRSWDANMINAKVGLWRLMLRLKGPNYTLRLCHDDGMPTYAEVAEALGEVRAVEYRDEFLILHLVRWLDANPPRPHLRNIMAGLELDHDDPAMRRRVESALRSIGWWRDKQRGWTGKPEDCWFPPTQAK